MEIAPENTISIDELQAAYSSSYGSLVGQLTVRNLGLEKQVQTLQAFIAKEQEETLRLKEENSKLIKAQIALEDEVHLLKKELDRLIKAGPTEEQIANQARIIIADSKNEAMRQK